MGNALAENYTFLRNHGKAGALWGWKLVTRNDNNINLWKTRRKYFSNFLKIFFRSRHFDRSEILGGPREISRLWGILGRLGRLGDETQKTRFWAQVSRNSFPELHIRSAESTNVLYDASKDELHTTSGTLSPVHRKIAFRSPTPGSVLPVYTSVHQCAAEYRPIQELW